MRIYYKKKCVNTKLKDHKIIIKTKVTNEENIYFILGKSKLGQDKLK